MTQIGGQKSYTSDPNSQTICETRKHVTQTPKQSAKTDKQSVKSDVTVLDTFITLRLGCGGGPNI